MTYFYALIAISLAFVLIERVRPRHPDQAILRPRLLTDVVYFVFNGHVLGVTLAILSAPLVARMQRLLGADETSNAWAVAETWPLALQFIVAFLAIDFLQWLIHNLLHRVPWLWSFHKVHHSIRHMDWWGSLRFHWFEIVVYKTLLYIPGIWFGFDPKVLFILALVSTTIGHFNHANLDVPLGPLRFVLNNPRMHVWHHHHEGGHPTLINFGINLSVWDYIFGTAHVPDRPPAVLGFDGIDTFPSTFGGQVLHPIPVERWVRRRVAGRCAAEAEPKRES